MMNILEGLFNKTALQEYILYAAQHPAGGLRDKPPKFVSLVFSWTLKTNPYFIPEMQTHIIRYTALLVSRPHNITYSHHLLVDR